MAEAVPWIGAEWALDDLPGAPPLAWNAAGWLGSLPAASVVLLASGRAALCCAIAALDAPGVTVLLPAYGCPALTQAAASAGAQVAYYPGDGAARPDWDAVGALAAATGARLAVIVHAFGLLQDGDAVRRLRLAHGLRVIEDCSHTLCNGPGAARLGPDGAAATVASLRKVLPVPAGGLCAIWADGGGRRPDAPEAPGRGYRPGATPPAAAPPLAAEPAAAPPASGAASPCSGAGSRDFDAARRLALALPPGPERHRLLQRAERALDRSAPSGPLSGEAEHALARLAAAPPAALDAWRAACRANRAALAEALGGAPFTVLHPALPPGACPPGLAIRHPDRTRLAGRLLASGIEAVLHWPVAAGARPHLSREERLLAGTILTLPCDGRYSGADMARVAASCRRHGA